MCWLFNFVSLFVWWICLLWRWIVLWWCLGLLLFVMIICCFVRCFVVVCWFWGCRLVVGVLCLFVFVLVWWCLVLWLGLVGWVKWWRCIGDWFWLVWGWKWGWKVVYLCWLFEYGVGKRSVLCGGVLVVRMNVMKIISVNVG